MSMQWIFSFISFKNFQGLLKYFAISTDKWIEKYIFELSSAASYNNVCIKTFAQYCEYKPVF